jgi:hypothetical protein
MFGLLRKLSLSILCWSILASDAASQCYSPQDPLRALEAADAVFVGLVLELPEVFVTPLGDTFPTRIRLHMVASWKGPTADTLTMLGLVASDAYSFKLGKTYLVYAKYVGPELEYLSSPNCTPTRPYEEARDHLLALGRPLWPEDCVATRIVEGEVVCQRRRARLR